MGKKTMDSDPLPYFIDFALIFALILINGFFVAAEFAVVKMRATRLDNLSQSGNFMAKFAINIHRNLNAYLSACQLGITLTSLGIGWLGEPTIAKLLRPFLTSMGLSETFVHAISFGIAFAIITFLHITIGEQVPKTLAIRKSEKVAIWSSLPLILFYKIFYPFIWLLNKVSNGMLRAFGVEPEEDHDSAHTDEEIRILMKESHKNGYLDKTELMLMDNIFEFTETTAREIMIPRTEMLCLYANLPYNENKRIAIESLKTRYPICDQDKDNIIGFVHIKDLLKNDTLDNIQQIIRPITRVVESMSISTLLKMMQKNKTQMVLLIDEYGGTSGLVTFEDIIEEIVGEVQDEFDKERPRIEKKDITTYSVDGLLLIEEFNDFFKMDISSDDFDTIGGWMYSQIEIPPSKNQEVKFNEDYIFIVDEVDNMRISRISVKKIV